MSKIQPFKGLFSGAGKLSCADNDKGDAKDVPIRETSQALFQLFLKGE